MVRKILITGAGGFIGSHLAKELFNKGNFVRGVDIKWCQHMQETYCSEKLTLDLRVFKNCQKVTRGIDWVFNLAANMGGCGFIAEVGADIMYDNTLINTNMLQASMENKIKRFFFSSSACIYPKYLQESPDMEGLREDDAYPADPDSFYGWEKLYMEKLCEAYRRDYGLAIRIARYHNVYGPEGAYQGGREKSIAALCRKVAVAPNPGEIEIWGDGKQTRSYCYIDDCVRGTCMLMESDYVKPLNIGSDRLVTIDKLTDLIIEISNKRITKKYNLSAPQGVRGRNADLRLVKEVLRWSPRISLEIGVANVYRWIENKVSKSVSGIQRNEAGLSS